MTIICHISWLYLYKVAIFIWFPVSLEKNLFAWFPVPQRKISRKVPCFFIGKV